MNSIDFKYLCEEVLLESELENFLIDISDEAVEIKDTFEDQKQDPKVDQKFLLLATRQELKKLRDEFKNTISKYNVDLSTTEKLDKFLYDKSKLSILGRDLEGLVYLLSKYIGRKYLGE